MPRETTELDPADFSPKWRERFLSKMKDVKSGCVEWTGARNKGGYGFVMTPSRTPRMAHRIAFILHTGKPLASGVLVCHSCDNPPCCNPEHLFAGSDSTNHADRGEKGRTRVGTGERNAHAKLSTESVREIRKLSKEGWETGALSKRFGVSIQNIRTVIAKKTWKHVTS